MARDGLPWHILATGATADWEDEVGLKIKQTGKRSLSYVARSSADIPTFFSVYATVTPLTHLLPCGQGT